MARCAGADVAVRGAGEDANVAFRGGELILSEAIGLDTRKRGIVELYRACLLIRTAEPQGRLAVSASWLQAISFRQRATAVA